MEKKVINTNNAPAPIGPYNQAIQFGNMLFISGQIAINPATGNIDATDIFGETHQVMHNLKSILTEAGMDFNHIIKTTIFLSDMGLFATVNAAPLAHVDVLSGGKAALEAADRKSVV